MRDSLCMTDVRERAVEGDAVADVNVEAVLPVGLVNPVRVRQRERFPLLTVTWVKHKQAGMKEARQVLMQLCFQTAFMCEGAKIRRIPRIVFACQISCLTPAAA